MAAPMDQWRCALNSKQQAKYEARARVIKALAHPSRLFIVEQLADGEECVCRLTEMIGADISTVSKHLATLKNAGIVRDAKRGAQVFYSLRTPCVLNFMSCIESVLGESAKEQLACLR
jgi:ArsR family transcriptional regulator